MSVKCMSRVWESSTVGGTELLVLLAIADHANEDGTGAWPAISTLATKCKVSERTIQRTLKNLVTSGEMKISYGTGKYGTNEYSVLTGLYTKSSGDIKIICQMCGVIKTDNVLFDKHHRVPGDDKSIVDLCRSCHQKLHQLVPQIGGDNMTPRKSGGVTPRDEGVTSEVQRGDIAMTPKPSLTINNHHNNNRHATTFVGILSKASGLATFPADQLEWMEVIRSLVEQYGEDKTIAALKSACTRWCSTPNKSGKPYKRTDLRWINWAQEELASDGKRVITKPLSEMTNDEFREYLQAQEEKMAQAEKMNNG